MAQVGNPGRQNEPTLMGLPLEIRDMVYEQVFREKNNVKGWWQERRDAPRFRYDYSVRSAETNLRLVCRQMKIEYEDSLERFPGSRVLRVEQTRIKPPDKIPHDIPSFASQSTHLAVEVHPYSSNRERGVLCDAGSAAVCSELEEWRESLKKYKALLDRLPTVRTTSIQLSVEPTECLKHIVEEAIRFPMITHLDVLFRETYDHEYYDRPTYLVRWSRERGFLLQNTDAKTGWELVNETHLRNSIPAKPMVGPAREKREAEARVVVSREAERSAEADHDNAVEELSEAETAFKEAKTAFEGASKAKHRAESALEEALKAEDRALWDMRAMIQSNVEYEMELLECIHSHDVEAARFTAMQARAAAMLSK